MNASLESSVPSSREFPNSLRTAHPQRKARAAAPAPRPALATVLATVACFQAGEFSVPADLIARYSFETLANGVVTDTSGRGNDGVVHGTLSLDAGVVGNAARFDGGGYVEIPASAGIDLGSGSQMTWIFSMKRDNALGGCYQRGVPEMNLFSKSDLRPEADADSGFHFLIANDSPSFYFTKGLGNQRHLEPVAPLGEWSRIALIKEDTHWRLYQNGVALPGFDTAMGEPGIWGVGDPFVNGDFEPMNEAPMLIGAVLNDNAGGIPADLFKGWMDEIKIYDQALTPQQLVNEGILASPTVPLDHYTQLLGEAPDELASWPWDPAATRCDGPCACPDTLPNWTGLLAFLIPLVLAPRIAIRPKAG